MRRKSKLIIIFIVFVILTLGYYLYRNYSIDNNLGEFTLVKKDKYDTAYEKKEALEKYNINKKAEIIKNTDVKDKVIALTFEGIKNRETTEEILDLLDLYDAKATFVITGVEAAEDPSLVKMIEEEGYDIGSGTLSGEKDMQNLETEELVGDFLTANNILKDITKKNTRLLKCKSTTYSNELLASAYAAGNKYVIKPNYYLSYQSFNDYKEVSGYVKKLSNGDIISINLDGVLDEFEFKKTTKEEKPAIDKQESVNENKNEEDIYGTTVVDIVEWILDALTEEGITPVEVKKLPIISKNIEGDFKSEEVKDNDKYIINNYFAAKNPNKETNKETSSIETPNNDNAYIKNLINKNNKNTVPVISRFLTTQKAVSYTFRGLSDGEVLDNILLELSKYNVKGTFFVTKNEIEDYPERIDKIIRAGHEVANGGITKDSRILNKSTEEVCNEIYEVDKLLKDKGIYTNAYMPGYGYYNENIQEAVSTIKQINGLEGYELIKYTKAPIINKYESMSPIEIVNDYFNVNYYVSLSKGEIVYFRLDSEIFKDKYKISNIIGVLTENYVKNGYVRKFNKETKDYDFVQMPLNYNVASIKSIQNISEDLMGYGRYEIVSNFKKLEKVNDVSELIKNNYIGNKNISLDGFSNEEIKNINKSGTINTKGEDVIFLTFDDWGGDPVINSILDVLDKHNVKASFFTISRYIDINGNLSNVNPNLLRTIALKGHDIGSHSYNHDLLNSNKKDLETSLIESYNTIGSIVGDLNAFKKYFRPPTLYVNKDGLSTVFESGYKYSISGNISTHDYEEESSDKIVQTIEGELVDGVGNIVIMHMNNQSYYTAEAIDKFLTNNENGVYGKKYKIAKLSDYLEE